MTDHDQWNEHQGKLPERAHFGAGLGIVLVIVALLALPFLIPLIALEWLAKAFSR